MTVTLPTGEEVVTVEKLAAPVMGCFCKGDPAVHGGVWLCELVDGTFVEAYGDELQVAA